MNARTLQYRGLNSRWYARCARAGGCRFLPIKGNARRALELLTVACIACIGLGITGCAQPEPEHLHVSGAVFVDGEPVPGVQVVFHPQDAKGGSVASGITDANGFFTLLSGLEAGVLPGSYRVVAIWPDPSVKPTEVEVMMGMAEPGPDLLGGRYSSLQTSSLTADISPETTLIPPFELSTSDVESL